MNYYKIHKKDNINYIFKGPCLAPNKTSDTKNLLIPRYEGHGVAKLPCSAAEQGSIIYWVEIPSGREGQPPVARLGTSHVSVKFNTIKRKSRSKAEKLK